MMCRGAVPIGSELFTMHNGPFDDERQCPTREAAINTASVSIEI
jgi:hypothetical protein